MDCGDLEFSAAVPVIFHQLSQGLMSAPQWFLQELVCDTKIYLGPPGCLWDWCSWTLLRTSVDRSLCGSMLSPFLLGSWGVCCSALCFLGVCPILPSHLPCEFSSPALGIVSLFHFNPLEGCGVIEWGSSVLYVPNDSWNRFVFPTQLHVCFLYAFYIIVVLMCVCVCSFFGCIEYTCHECTYPRPLSYSCDSFYLWTHILSYMFVLPIFASVRVFYLHHFLIPYCIFIVRASIWFCAREHRCACWCSVMCPSEYHLQFSHRLWGLVNLAARPFTC